MPNRLCLALPVAALMLLAACNSRNPDALNAANVDENYANEANYAENVDAASADASPAAAGKPSANQAETNAQANIDAAVNSLRDLEAEDNEVQQAENQFTRRRLQLLPVTRGPAGGGVNSSGATDAPAESAVTTR